MFAQVNTPSVEKRILIKIIPAYNAWADLITFQIRIFSSNDYTKFNFFTTAAHQAVIFIALKISIYEH